MSYKDTTFAIGPIKSINRHASVRHANRLTSRPTMRPATLRTNPTLLHNASIKTLVSIPSAQSRKHSLNYKHSIIASSPITVEKIAISDPNSTDIYFGDSDYPLQPNAFEISKLDLNEESERPWVSRAPPAVLDCVESMNWTSSEDEDESGCLRSAILDALFANDSSSTEGSETKPLVPTTLFSSGRLASLPPRNSLSIIDRSHLITHPNTSYSTIIYPSARTKSLKLSPNIAEHNTMLTGPNERFTGDALTHKLAYHFLTSSYSETDDTSDFMSSDPFLSSNNKKKLDHNVNFSELEIAPVDWDSVTICPGFRITQSYVPLDRSFIRNRSVLFNVIPPIIMVIIVNYLRIDYVNQFIQKKKQPKDYFDLAYSFDKELLIKMGALSVNYLRNVNEWSRVLIHLIVHRDMIQLSSVIAILVLFGMNSNKVGPVRTLLMFITGDLVGSMLSMALAPCDLVVGCGAGAYALFSAHLVLILEFRYTSHICRDFLLFLFILVCTIGYSLAFDTSYWSHLGGSIGGVLMALVTVTDIECFGTLEQNIQQALVALLNHERRSLQLNLSKDLSLPNGRGNLRTWYRERRLRFGLQIGAYSFSFIHCCIRLVALVLLVLCYTVGYAMIYHEDRFNSHPGSFSFNSGEGQCVCCWVEIPGDQLWYYCSNSHATMVFSTLIYPAEFEVFGDVCEVSTKERPVKLSQFE